MNEELDMNSLQHFLSFQYVPEPSTLSKNIEKLLPGHYFTKEPGKKMDIKRFWKPIFHPSNIDDSKVIKEIQDTLMDSVNVHMRSDVPVGSFYRAGLIHHLSAPSQKRLTLRSKLFLLGSKEMDIVK